MNAEIRQKKVARAGPEPGDSKAPEKTSLCVIMPAYNEEESIVSAVADIQENILDRVSGAKLIVVNDGSKDKTGALLDRLASEDSRVHVHHQENGGHGAALVTGLSIADSEYILLVDSDRQIPLTSFSDFWNAIQQGYDGAFGVRRVRHDPAVRIWLTRVIRVFVQQLFDIELFDGNVPYKLLKRSIWTDASRYIPEDTLAPSLFLAIYAKRKRHRIAEIEVSHRERDTGEVSIRRLKLLKFCARAFKQMLGFRQAISHVQ